MGLKYEERQTIGDKEKSSDAKVPTPLFLLAIICLKAAAVWARLADILLLDTHHIEVKAAPKLK